MIFLSTIPLRRWRLRGRLVAVALALVMAAAVAWVHGAPGMDHMQMADVVAVCLAVEGFVAVALAGFAPPTPVRPYGPRAALIALDQQRPRSDPAVHARDGPALLQVFRI